MIQELRIKNFLSFKDEVVFSFEATADKSLEDYYIHEPVPGVRLLKLALVYGANASGKSNLINAFGFLRNFVFNIPQSKEDRLNFNPFEFDTTRNQNGKLSLIFYIDGIKYAYSIELNRKYIVSESLFYYPGTQPASIFQRGYIKSSEMASIKFGPKIKVSKLAAEEITLRTLKNSSVLSAYSNVNTSITELEKVYKWFRDHFLMPVLPDLNLIGMTNPIKDNPELKEQALKFLQKADFNITGISFESETFRSPKVSIKRTRKDDSGKYVDDEMEIEEKEILNDTTLFEHHIIKDGKEEYYNLPENRQSKGTLRYYGMSIPFYYTIQNNAFLPIDEIGSSLHPILVKHFIKEFLLQKSTAQLLITTHNMSLLNEKDILRKDAIWFTDKKDNGATDLYSAADFVDFRKELSYFNYYKSGKFGAVPNID